MREPETPEQRQLIAGYLELVDTTRLVRFTPYHDDRLDAQVRAGRFARVVFADLDALLAAVWKGHVHLDAWLESDVTIELIDPSISAQSLRDTIAQVYASFTRFQDQHRRRRVIAAIILSVLVLAGMAAMIWIIPVSR